MIINWKTESQGVTPVTSIHPDGDTNVCMKFNTNLSSRCGDIWFETTIVNLMVAQEEKSEYHPSLGFIVWESQKKCVNPIWRHFSGEVKTLTCW